MARGTNRLPSELVVEYEPEIGDLLFTTPDMRLLYDTQVYAQLHEQDEKNAKEQKDKAERESRKHGRSAPMGRRPPRR